MTRSAKPSSGPTTLFTMKMRNEVYARLKSAAINTLASHRSMSDVVHAALERYLADIEAREPTFDEVYIRERPLGTHPLPVSHAMKAMTYGAAPEVPMNVRFHSQTLRHHYERSIWNQHTWALIRRERRWRGENGERVYTGFPLPTIPPGEGTEEHLPPSAQSELGPLGKP